MAEEKSQLKIKKKTWYQVYTNKAFGETFIGELPLTEAGLMSGRYISTNLMNLTGNPKNQNVNLKFRVEKIIGAKGIAYPSGYTIMPSSLRRLIKRKSERIDDAFTCTTSDNVKIRVKPLVVTRGQTKNSVITLMRKIVRKLLTSIVQNSNYITFFTDIINYRVQKAMRDHLKKVYPVSVCEIRVAEAMPNEKLGDLNEEVKRAAELLERKMPERKPEEAPQAAVPENKDAEESKPEQEEVSQETAEENQ